MRDQSPPNAGHGPDSMLSSPESGEYPQLWENIPIGEPGDMRALIRTARQAVIIVLCAFDDYLGIRRTIITKRGRT